MTGLNVSICLCYRMLIEYFSSLKKNMLIANNHPVCRFPLSRPITCYKKINSKCHLIWQDCPSSRTYTSDVLKLFVSRSTRGEKSLCPKLLHLSQHILPTPKISTFYKTQQVFTSLKEKKTVRFPSANIN